MLKATYVIIINFGGSNPTRTAVIYPCGGFIFIVPPCVFYVIMPLAIDTTVMLIPFCNTAKASIAFWSHIF